MERNDDDLTLDGLDDQIEWHARGPRALPLGGGPPSPTTRLIQGLRRSYENEQADEQSVAAVWQRLAERGAVPAPQRQRARTSHSRQSQPETWQPPRSTPGRPRWTLASRLTAIVAAVALVAVVSGLVIGLALVRQPRPALINQPTATPGHTIVASPSPTAQGQMLAYIGSDNNVWEMTWPGGTPKQLTSNATSTNQYTWLAWSPDGSLLAAVRETVSAGIGSIVILKPDGSVVATASLTGGWYDTPPVWSPDGTMLAFRGYADPPILPSGDNAGKLYLLNPQTGKTEKALTYDLGTSQCGPSPRSSLDEIIGAVDHGNYSGFLDTFVWAPDQRSMLASYGCDAQVAKVDLSTGATTLPYPLYGSYQPGGNLILGYWHDGTLGLTDLSANHVRALVKPEPYVNPPTYVTLLAVAIWARNGQSVYYEHDDSIWQIGVDGSNPHQVVAGTALDSQQNATVQLLPSPSPDGLLLLYLQAVGSNRVVNGFYATPQPTPTEPLTTRWYIAQADGTNPAPLPSGISDVVWRPGK